MATGKHLKRDLVGQTFGRLTVIAELPKAPSSPNSRWACVCSCGGGPDHSGMAFAFGHNLIAGRTRSCGCLRDERLRECEEKRLQAMRDYWARWRANKGRTP